MPAYPTNAARCRELAQKLEASADRICEYQDRLKAGTSTLKPIEFERLMAECRFEEQRYSQIEHELSGADKQLCLKEKQAQNLMKNRKKRDKIIY